MASNHASKLVFSTIKEAGKSGITIKKVSELTKYSEIYTRNLVKSLEVHNFIEKIDDRQPFLYIVRVDEARENINKIKDIILNGDTDKNPFINVISQAPRSEWKKASVTLINLAKAIQELESEGKLVDTL